MLIKPSAVGKTPIGVGGDGQWRALCVALGRPELGTAPDYATNDMRLRNRPKLTALLSDIFKTKPSAQWLDLLEQQGVPAGPIYKVDEVFADPQVQHLGIVQKVGDVAYLGQPVTLSRTPSRVAAHPPALGEHTAEVLRDLGYGDAEVEQLRNRGIV